MNNTNRVKNTAQWHWLHKNTKHIYISLAMLTIFGMILAYIGVQLALSSKDVVDVATKAIDGNLVEKIIAILILVLLQLIIQSWYAIMNVRVSGKLSISLKENLFNCIMKKDYQKISEYHSGELLNRINSDVSVITSGVMTIIPNILSLSFRIIFAIFALFVLSSSLATFYVIAGPLILLSARFFSNKMKSLHKKIQETDGKTRSFMQECLQNLLVIKAYKKEDAITNFSRIFQYENFKFMLKRNNLTVIMNILFYMALTAGFYLSLAYCAYQISIGLMTVGTLTAILQLIGQVQAPFKDLSSVVPQYYAMLASVERILEIENITANAECHPMGVQNEECHPMGMQNAECHPMGMQTAELSSMDMPNCRGGFPRPPAVGNDPRVVPPNQTLHPPCHSDTLPCHSEQSEESTLRRETSLYEHHPFIQIKNLSFSYKDEIIFDDANFTMQNGEFIAISGISGIGKSTLLKLIMGILHPQQGKIIVNSTNDNTSNVFAYVPQGNMILSGTIKENIAFYNSIEEDRIIESAKTAEIFDFIETLPNKFDTILGEKGLGLSEGQIQRIAIARAIYYDAPLLLLDEATSALDEETENKVLTNIKNLRNKSCIVISHKKSAFEICDRQISLINNKIIH